VALFVAVLRSLTTPVHANKLNLSTSAASCGSASPRREEGQCERRKSSSAQKIEEKNLLGKLCRRLEKLNQNTMPVQYLWRDQYFLLLQNCLLLIVLNIDCSSNVCERKFANTGTKNYNWADGS
jgi:hypothetical protein